MRFFFNLFGMIIVVSWLVMIGLLVKKIHFQDRPAGINRVQYVGTIDFAQREWKEIYLKGKKVGYAFNQIKPLKTGYLIQEEIFLKLNLMGLASGAHTVTRSRVDKKFLLKSFNFNMKSGAVGFNISGRVEGDRLLIETGAGSDRKTRRITLTGPPMIAAGMSYYFKHKEIKEGDSFSVPLFDPSTMAQKDIVIKVVAREPVSINSSTYNTFRLEADMWGSLMTFWLDEDGTTLKEEGFMGLTIVKSRADKAPLDIEGEAGIDLYDMTAVKVDKKLPDSTRLSYLKFRIDGIDLSTVNTETWNRGRQRFHEGIMEITREKPPFKASFTLPYDQPDGEMRGSLEPEFNIESDEDEIINKAREISGKDKDPVSVVKKLSSWVFNNLEKRPVVSIPSALEVLRTGVGDCNEHATLLTALLRALKIPARLSIGLVYTRGKFFYHAWTEAYTGEWISMDPTLDQMPVDATHIKLLEGNLDKQVEIAGLIGKIKLEIIDYRYD